MIDHNIMRAEGLLRHEMRTFPNYEGKKPVTSEMLQEADPEFVASLLFLLQCTPDILRVSTDFDGDPLAALQTACQYAWATERADPDTIAASEETMALLRSGAWPYYTSPSGETPKELLERWPCNRVTGTLMAPLVTASLPYGHFALLSTKTPCWVPFRARGPIEFDPENDTYIGLTAPWIQCYFTPLQKEND